MRKSLIFLTALFVCALMQMAAPAQSQNNDSADVPDNAAIAIDPSAGMPDSLSNALSSSEIADKIVEAKQLLKTQLTRSTSAEIASVTLAALDTKQSQIHIFSLPKDSFLVKGAELTAQTQLGDTVRVQVIRANGVNTAVTVTDTLTGRAFLPLMVEYPIVRGGVLSETAYYTSAHPALLSLEVVSTGKTYVGRMLEEAADHLAQQGVDISPDIVTVAEHLCIVEHTDHQRFLSESASALFPEILSLYALNEGNTYRYSVSSAGAGGMIQMIPRTYEGIRKNHPTVTLNSDFVSGMRDHGNALEAMLLYMQDTWKVLEQSADVQNALQSGIATKPELLATGYNSNPMRLPAYLKNGGSEWRTLIPAETQMYLAIYSAVDNTIKFDDRAGQKDLLSEASRNSNTAMLVAGRNGVAVSVMSWLSNELMSGQSLVARILP